MAIAEPNNELWAAVKAIANPWPPDDEDRVTKLAEDWRRAAQTAQLSGTTLSEAQRAAKQAWPDSAGQLMGQKLGNGTTALQSQQQNAERQAALADQYAQTLMAVKTAIVHVININLPTYLQLGNPSYGAAGAARQQQFAEQVAAQLQALVDAHAAQLQAPPPAPPASDETLMEKAGDIAGVVSAVAGGLALIPGVQLVAAPIALLSGGIALGLHTADMVATGDYEGKWVTVAGDVVGLVPGARALNGLMDGTSAAVRGSEVVLAALDVGLQAPTVKDLLGDGDELNDQSKDLAGTTGLVKNMVVEGLEATGKLR